MVALACKLWFQVPTETSFAKQNARGLVDPRVPLENLKKLVSLGDPDAGKLMRFSSEKNYYLLQKRPYLNE